MYKPYHLIGLELAISVASIMARGKSTGTTRDFRGDVVAVAKRNLFPGEALDGEGGQTVYGKLTPARKSLILRALPIGLSNGCPAKPARSRRRDRAVGPLRCRRDSSGRSAASGNRGDVPICARPGRLTAERVDRMSFAPISASFGWCVLRARNGMTAFARTPVLAEAILLRSLSM